jgi:hypothetical protein
MPDCFYEMKIWEWLGAIWFMGVVSGFILEHFMKI